MPSSKSLSFTSRIALTWQRLVGFGFRLLYNEMAWTYDMVSWLVSLGQWREWQRTAVAYITGPHVLEIAHGPGHMLLTLNQSGFQVVGLDLSPWMGQMARRRLRRAGTAVPLVRGRAEKLPFAPASFDTVLATFPTEFVVQPETLAVVYSVLKPDGRFIIVPEARLTGSSLLHRFIEWLYAITGQREGPTVPASGDSERVNPSARWSAYGRRFAAAGFRIEAVPVRLKRSIVTVIIAHKGAEEATNYTN